MDTREATDHLAAIRRIMESASQLTVLPGKAGIVGGVLALAGCAATYGLMKSLDFAQMAVMEARPRGILIGLWVSVGMLAVAIDVLMTARLARRRGKNPWSRLLQLGACTMGPCIVMGVVLTVAFALRNQWSMVPAVWMILYGGSLWVVGTLSVRAPRILGLVFFLLGVVTLFWAGHVSLVMVAASFGLAHILFGVYLLARFGE